MADNGGKAARIDQRLTYLKDQSGFSWDEIADRAGISGSGLRKIRYGEVTPRKITREGLAYALSVGRSEIDELFDVDDSTAEPEGVTWADMAVARPENMFVRLAAGSGKSYVSALLIDLPPRLLADLTEAEIATVQTKVAEYAVFVATQTIQDRT